HSVASLREIYAPSPPQLKALLLGAVVFTITPAGLSGQVTFRSGILPSDRLLIVLCVIMAVVVVVMMVAVPLGRDLLHFDFGMLDQKLHRLVQQHAGPDREPPLRLF